MRDLLAYLGGCLGEDIESVLAWNDIIHMLLYLLTLAFIDRHAWGMVLLLLL
jgi:hypothetical protein